LNPASGWSEPRGRVAVVTGAGRPRSLGTAICLALAANGADVFFTHWGADEAEPEALLERLREAGIRAEGMELDLSIPEFSEMLLDAAAERLGPPAILVNNAAHSERGGYETLDAHYAVNLRATALLSVHFVRRFDGDYGRIVNLTSGQSLGPMPSELAYAATKGAIEAFTRTLAAEVGHKGITVNAVNPGPTNTGWMTGELRRDLAAKFPAGRVGEPEDAARPVAFLASEEDCWVTGQVIHSEGGFLRD
jgi:3-oxoacyl-[acyl-carrier protein] reductase